MKRVKLKTDYVSPVAEDLFIVSTGDWRYQRPVTDLNRCRMCTNCWLMCPTNSRYSTGSHFETDLTYCKGCGVCANECAAGAVKMVEEPRTVKAKVG